MTNTHKGCITDQGKRWSQNGNVMIYNKKGKGPRNKKYPNLKLKEIKVVQPLKGPFMFVHPAKKIKMHQYTCDVCGENQSTTNIKKRRCTDCKIEFDRARARRQQSERRESERLPLNPGGKKVRYKCLNCFYVGTSKYARVQCSKCRELKLPLKG